MTAALTDEELAAIKGLVLGNVTTLHRLVAEVERLKADNAEWLCARCGRERDERRIAKDRSIMPARFNSTSAPHTATDMA